MEECFLLASTHLQLIWLSYRAQDYCSEDSIVHSAWASYVNLQSRHSPHKHAYRKWSAQVVIWLSLG